MARKICIVAFSVICISTVLSSGCSSEILGTSNPATEPAIRFEKSNRNIGLVQMARSKDARSEPIQFEFENIGSCPVVIVDVKTECSCATSHFEIEEIAPGGRGSVELAVDVGGRSREVRSSAVVLYRSADISRDTQVYASRISVVGIVAERPIAMPAAVDFGSIKSDLVKRPVRLRFPIGESMECTFTSDTDRFSSVQDLVLDKRSETHVDFIAGICLDARNLVAGTAIREVQTFLFCGQELDVAITARVAHESLDATPKSLVFARHESIHEKARSELAITYPADGSMPRISEVSSPGNSVHLIRTETAADGSARMLFEALAETPVDGVILIQFDDSRLGPLKIPFVNLGHLSLRDSMTE